MATQTEHFDTIKTTFEEMCRELIEGAELNKEIDPKKVRSALGRMAEGLRGLDLRLVNDDLKNRVIEGSERAVAAVAERGRALSNANAAVTPNGQTVDTETATAFIQAFLDATQCIDIQYHPRSFVTCLTLMTKMLTGTSTAERDVLRHMLQDTRDRDRS